MLLNLLLLTILIGWHARSPSGKVFLFAGLYAGIPLALGLLFSVAGGHGLPPGLIFVAALRLVAAAAFFWLLDHFHGFLGWLVTILGGVALVLFL